MAVFGSTDQMYDALGALLRALYADPTFGPAFRKENLVVRFVMHEPDGEISVTPAGVVCGPTSEKPTIEMWLSGDTCHRFWLKKVNLPIALAKGLIRAKGPLPKIMKLLPLLKPAYGMYPDIARQNGLPIA